MIAKLHISVGEYEFVETEIDVKDIDEAINLYKITKGIYLSSLAGLSRQEWNGVLDKYLKEEATTSDEHERMNRAQAWMIHELDKAKERISAN